jgi:hypothetical protein
VPKNPNLPSIVSWHVWLERNKVIFENGSPSIYSIVFKSLGGIDRLVDAKKVLTSRSFKTSFQDFATVGWFDGATLSNGQ